MSRRNKYKDSRGGKDRILRRKNMELDEKPILFEDANDDEDPEPDEDNEDDDDGEDLEKDLEETEKNDSGD